MRAFRSLIFHPSAGAACAVCSRAELRADRSGKSVIRCDISLRSVEPPNADLCVGRCGESALKWESLPDPPAVTTRPCEAWSEL